MTGRSEVTGGDAVAGAATPAPPSALGALREGARASFALASRGSTAALQLLMVGILGRLAGPAALGDYLLFATWAAVLTTVLGLGFPVLAVREVSRYLGSGDPASARALWLRLLTITTAVAGVAAVAGWSTAPSLAQVLLGRRDAAFLVSLAVTGSVASGVLVISCETLKSCGRASLALLVQYGLTPIIVIATALTAFGMGRSLDARLAAGAHVVSLAIGAAVSVVIVGRLLPRIEGADARPSLDTTAASRFWMVTLLVQGTAALPLLVLPHLTSAVQVGLYGAADRVASVSIVLLLALASVYSPQFARAHAAGDPSGLRRLLRRSQLLGLLGYLPLFVAALAAGGTLLGLMGDQFREARLILWILVSAQLLNAATGLVVNFNTMTGAERFEVWASWAYLAVVVALGVALGTRFDATGVAVAAALGMACKKAVSWWRAEATIARMRAAA